MDAKSKGLFKDLLEKFQKSTRDRNMIERCMTKGRDQVFIGKIVS